VFENARAVTTERWSPRTIAFSLQKRI